MFASPAYADWEKVIDGVNGTFYVDFERMRTNGGYVYYWQLADYLEPSPQGILSSKVYYRGDCEMVRHKNLSYIFYVQPMGEGSGETVSPPNPEWKYPPPNSVDEETLKRVCRRAGL